MQTTSLDIVQKLRDHGFEALYAGGFVRDMLLGIEAKDIDIATNATPDQIEEIFENTYPIGKAFGVIHVNQNGFSFEIATFRRDGEYEDGRRPKTVHFSDSREDALRRDFTINGLFYDPITKKIIDYVGGQKDLEERVVQFIGTPDERIQEDHLRMLRAVRFAHQINGQFEPQTYASIKKHAKLVGDVSKERIRDELNKMLISKTRAKALEDLQDLGLLTLIFPELEKLKGIAQPRKYHREGSVWDHVMKGIMSIKSSNINLIWATLLHDIGKPDTYHMDERIRFNGHAEKSAEIAEVVLTRLRFSNREKEQIVWAVKNHMSLFHLIGEDTSEKTKREWFMHPAFPLLLELHRADVLGTSPHDLTSYNALKNAYQIRKEAGQLKIPKLISGDEIGELLGLKEGKEIGKILEEIKDKQMLGEIETRAEVIEYITRQNT